MTDELDPRLDQLRAELVEAIPEDPGADDLGVAAIMAQAPRHERQAALVEAARAGGGADALVQGVDMVRRLFLSKLEGFGVTRVDPLGEPFDPARHEAVTMVPTDDPAQDNTVYAVLAPGYVLHDDVLRPAMVAVGRHSSDSAAS